MTTAARIAGIFIALAAAGVSRVAGQSGVIRIVALDSTIRLPGGWKLVEDAGPRGCAFETPEGVRVEVVVWTPGPPAHGPWDERHAAWEHGILLKRSCDFTSRREREAVSPFGGRGLLVIGRARSGGLDWAGAYLAFSLDSRRACVIGAFAPALVGAEVAVQAIFELVEALRASQQGAAPMLVARPEERLSGGLVTAGTSPVVEPTAQMRPARLALAVPMPSGETLTLVPDSRPRPAASTGEGASLSPTRPWLSEAPALGARVVPVLEGSAFSPGPVLAEQPRRLERVELAASPPIVAAAVLGQAEVAQTAEAGLGATIAAPPERPAVVGSAAAGAARQLAALADSRPRLAALPNTAAAIPVLEKPVVGQARAGLTEGRVYAVRPTLASVAARVTARTSVGPAIAVATAQATPARGLTSPPTFPGLAVLARQRPLAAVRRSAGSLFPAHSTPGSSGKLALSPVVRETAGRPVLPTMDPTRPVVAVRTEPAAVPEVRRLLELPKRSLPSAVTLAMAALAASEKLAMVSTQSTSTAVAIRPRQARAFRLTVLASPVPRAAPAAGVAAASPARLEAQPVPAQAVSTGTKGREMGEPLAALPASGGPATGWVSDDGSLVRIKVPVGWKVSVKVTGSPGNPALAVYGVHAKDPNLRFVWVQPSLPRYRDLSQLLVAMGYREWQAYKDTATGEELVIAKRRGARRLLEDVVLPGSNGGLRSWQILDAQPSATAAGLAGSGEGLVAHVMGLGEHGAVEGWYSVAVGTLPGQSAQTWVGAWLVALGPPGDGRALEALAQAVGASTVQPEAGEELRSMVAAAQAAVRDLSRGAGPGQ